MTQTQVYNTHAGALMESELASQPDAWVPAVGLTAERALLPASGERVAVVGCGTSWFMAQSYAAARESAGKGTTDAFAASEAFINRGYDVIVAITRSADPDPSATRGARACTPTRPRPRPAAQPHPFRDPRLVSS